MQKKLALFLFSITTLLTFGMICLADIETLIATQNQQELEKYIYENHHDFFIKTSCLLQLKNKKIPFTCYEWFSKFLRPSLQQESTVFLDEKCLELASSLKHLEEITHIIRNPYISSTCSKKLQEVKSVLIYQLRDQPVEKFLQWHLRKEF